MGADAYGGTYRLLTRVFGAWGVSVSTVDLGNPDALESAITTATKMIWSRRRATPF